MIHVTCRKRALSACPTHQLEKWDYTHVKHKKVASRLASKWRVKWWNGGDHFRLNWLSWSRWEVELFADVNINKPAQMKRTARIFWWIESLLKWRKFNSCQWIAVCVIQSDQSKVCLLHKLIIVLYHPLHSQEHFHDTYQLIHKQSGNLKTLITGAYPE